MSRPIPGPGSARSRHTTTLSAAAFDPFGGHSVVARPARPSDLRPVGAMLTRLSPTSRHARFFGPVVRFTPRLVRPLVDVDHQRHETLVALCGDAAIGMAEYIRLRSRRDEAEVAVVVEDAYQRHGVATFLFDGLRRLARDRGIAVFVASVQGDNRAALALARALFDRVETRWEDGATHLRIPLSSRRPAEP